jgi:hypothetical protein
MRPKFDHVEAYLVAYYRQYKKSSGRRSFVQEAITVAVGAAFFALGYFKNDVTWSIIGFGLVAYLALKGLISGTRYNGVMSSIIEKYEDALQAEDKRNTAKHDSTSNRG